MILFKARPTDAQKAAGNYRKRHIRFQGLDIAIENPHGSVRSGVDRGGKAWRTVMRADYGYINRTMGVDGDQVDVFIGPDAESGTVYVVTTLAPPDFTRRDEQKCMLGYASEGDARAAFLVHYDNPRFLGEVVAMPMEEFKEKVLNTKDEPRFIKGMVVLFVKGGSDPAETAIAIGGPDIGMQERPPLRADESGPVKEPAHSVGAGVGDLDDSAFLKSHIETYTRMDGTVVNAHDDIRQPAREKPKRARVNGKDTHSMAEAIARHAEKMGLDVYHHGSSLSSSQYVEVSHKVEGEEEPRSIKIRVSNHALPLAHKREHGEADYELSPHGEDHQDTHGTDWKDAVLWLSERTGRAPPKTLVAAISAKNKAEEASRRKSDDRALAMNDEKIVRLMGYADDPTVTIERSVSRRSGWLVQDGKRIGDFYNLSGANGKVPSSKSEAIGNAIAFLKRGGYMAKSISNGINMDIHRLLGDFGGDGATVLFLKGYVRAHTRIVGGKTVQVRSYHTDVAPHGKAASGGARRDPHTLALFETPEKAPLGPSPFPEECMRNPEKCTGDLFSGDADHASGETYTMPRQEAIEEHERLVDVLNSPSHEDDQQEALRQGEELAEMREDAPVKTKNQTIAKSMPILFILPPAAP